MILAYAIIFLTMLALLLRRDLSTLGQISYRGGWKGAIMVAGLFILQVGLIIYLPGQAVWQMGLLVLSQVALIFLILLNRHLPGAKIFALGIILNTGVMVANGGWMPVTPGTYHYVHPDQQTIEVQAKPVKSKNIILPRAETNLWILSDILRVSLPWRRNAVSIGDVLLVVGIAQFIFQATSEQEKQLLPT